MDSVYWQYSGVRAYFGEDVETLQSVHSAGARQESGKHGLLMVVCVSPSYKVFDLLTIVTQVALSAFF